MIFLNEDGTPRPFFASPFPDPFQPWSPTTSLIPFRCSPSRCLSVHQQLPFLPSHYQHHHENGLYRDRPRIAQRKSASFRSPNLSQLSLCSLGEHNRQSHPEDDIPA